MKYQQFADLCAREHENGHGDVVALCLTGASAVELANDILSPPGVATVLGDDPTERATVGVRASQAVNPVTQSTVAINVDVDADFDMATVMRPIAVQVASV